MSFEHTARDLSLKGMNTLHRAILRISGGRWLDKPFGMPTVELHTIGRKSGQPRSTLLTAPIHDEHQTVLIASKGGDDRNPEWYLNLVANPEVELTIGGVTQKMVARTAAKSEKDALWPRIVSRYKGYANYQKRTDRDIPVVICEPRG
jgi:deazaflavin-dependent oxidoreductase (nitroreductase family)